MCKILGISRNTYYSYLKKIANIKPNYDEQIIAIFKASKKSYGKRSVKEALEKLEIYLSIKKVRKIMKRLNLVSCYNKKSFVVHSKGVNDEKYENLLSRNFNNYKLNEVLVSDLTYQLVGNRHYYVCFVTDLYNREIVGHSVGSNKTPELVIEAFNSIKFNLKKVSIFHTDRGLEFKNSKIKSILDDNNIQRSLSRPGNPYDNAVAETMFKTFKTTWVQKTIYDDIIELINDVDRYVKWYNNIRYHSTLEYKSPVEYRLSKLTA